jgi:glycolate oxidase iron-sulfur subunit
VTIKDYGFMFRNDAVYAGKAARVSALAQDISEYLARKPVAPARDVSALTVAYHAACSLQHGQKLTREPKDLLSRLGFTLRDVPESHLCCGSAGTYNILQPDLATRLRERKVANIRKVEPDVIAAGNIGCITQIAAGIDVPVIHTIELVDWATGGPVPEGLKSREDALQSGA